MERQIPFQIVNAFGDRWRSGNAIAVVRERLDDRMMQFVAMDLNCPLTIFPQRTGERTYSVRMFNARSEVPYGGSGSLAAVWAMGSGAWTQTSSGAVVKTESRGNRAWTSQPEPEISRIDDPEISEAIGLRSHMALFLGSAAGNRHVVAITNDDPTTFRPSHDILRRVAQRYDGSTVGAVRRIANDEIHGRIFTPAHGVAEDPACGGGAVVIGRIMQREFGVSDRLRIREGEEIGRPSVMEVDLEMDPIRVGGQLYLAAEGFLRTDL